MNVYRTLNGAQAGVVIKAGRTSVRGWYIGNLDTNPAYVKLYNQASAPDELETPVMTLYLPATSAANLSIGPEVALDNFTAGLSVRCTSAPADASIVSPAANTLILNVFYN